MVFVCWLCKLVYGVKFGFVCVLIVGFVWYSYLLAVVLLLWGVIVCLDYWM